MYYTSKLIQAKKRTTEVPLYYNGTEFIPWVVGFVEQGSSPTIYGPPLATKLSYSLRITAGPSPEIRRGTATWVTAEPVNLAKFNKLTVTIKPWVFQSSVLNLISIGVDRDTDPTIDTLLRYPLSGTSKNTWEIDISHIVGTELYVKISWEAPTSNPSSTNYMDIFEVILS